MELDGYFRFLLALIFVLGLIGVLALAARRMGLGFPAAATRPSGARRLQVVEVTPIDGRRRLVLVRRDQVEHLLLISPTTERVVETGIVGPGPDRSAAPSVDTADFRAALRDVRDQLDPAPPGAADKPEPGAAEKPEP